MNNLINDIELETNLMKKEKNRFDYFIPNYLIKHIKKNDKVCSIGCGIGYDVQLLNIYGYNSYGFDPGNRTKLWKKLDKNVAKKLKVGKAEDIPFNVEEFDFMYALEVIEHVGCKNAYWKLEDNYLNIRIRFLESCLLMLKNNGRLLISTSNRLFPIDLGHGHHYSRLTDFFSKFGIRLTIPWHKKNFILSFNDIKKMLNKSIFKNQFEIHQLTTSFYPAKSQKGLKGKAISLFLSFFSFYPLIRFNPILVVSITKLSKTHNKK